LSVMKWHKRHIYAGFLCKFLWDPLVGPLTPLSPLFQFFNFSYPQITPPPPPWRAPRHVCLIPIPALLFCTVVGSCTAPSRASGRALARGDRGRDPVQTKSRRRRQHALVFRAEKKSGTAATTRMSSTVARSSELEEAFFVAGVASLVPARSMALVHRN
jgi:hypothetical protein